MALFLMQSNITYSLDTNKVLISVQVTYIILVLYKILILYVACNIYPLNIV